MFELYVAYFPPLAGPRPGAAEAAGAGAAWQRFSERTETSDPWRPNALEPGFHGVHQPRRTRIVMLMVPE